MNIPPLAKKALAEFLGVALFLTAITGSFRGVFTGYVSSNNCRDGDQCLNLRAAGGAYTLRYVIVTGLILGARMASSAFWCCATSVASSSACLWPTCPT